MSDDASRALSIAKSAFEVATQNAVIMSGTRALLPFALAGRMPTSEELAEIVSTLMPPDIERDAPDEAQAVRDWIFGVIGDARILLRSSREPRPHAE